MNEEESRDRVIDAGQWEWLCDICLDGLGIGSAQTLLGVVQRVRIQIHKCHLSLLWNTGIGQVIAGAGTDVQMAMAHELSEERELDILGGTVPSE